MDNDSIRDDPELRALEGLRNSFRSAFRLLAFTTLALTLVVSVAIGTVFWFRSNDLERITEANSKFNAKQQQTIAYLCETVHVIDAFYVQSAEIDGLLARQAIFNKEIRKLLLQRRSLSLTLHQELSDTRACQEVE